MLIQRLFATVALLVAAASAHADFVVSGQFVNQKDQARIDFNVLPGTAEVRIWTDSWQSGLNFDPLLSVFDASGKLLLSFDDNDGTVDPSAGFFDAGQNLGALAAGLYHLVLTASSNNPLGTQLSDGFAYDGDAAIALVDWNQPGYDVNKNDQKGGFWRVNFAGAVPEPATVALVLAALGGLAATRRRRG